MNAFTTHLLYEFRATLRDKTQLLMNYLFPLFFFGMMGLLMGKVNPTFKETMIPAMILVAVMSSTLLGMPGPMLSSREAGIFRSYKINGVPSMSILLIPILNALLHMVLVSIIITVAGYFFFDGVLPANWFLFVAVWLVSFLAFSGLGMLIGVVASNSRATILIAQLIFVPSMILGGLMMPTSMLPKSLGMIANLLPTGHAMSAFTSLTSTPSPQMNGYLQLGLLLITGILALGLSSYLFHWDNSIQRRRPALLGLIVLIPFVISMAL